MSYEVIVTENFRKLAKSLAKKHLSLKNDLSNLIESLENEPNQGVYLGKDCYKIRMAISSKGKGKSGGARVITCVKIVSNSVFMLTIYDKSNTDGITEKAIDDLLAEEGLSDE
ncbi:type II toxin-antitoxin system RelE/ParE family toxin [Haliscomenobacter sp.]|jgi:mRNA-degrading endonuclease RelE of RelBE toxin-antitoxin system|uniref:type II toxin-antitoxin system RelE/ParE family toxin n=1 Tax=Haliscomenobacter sp. TaxID=2717303 RepID=UPI003364C86F